MRFFFVVFLYSLCLLQLGAQTAPLPEKRSFNEIFPVIAADVRQEAFSNEGYSKSGKNVPRSSLIGAVAGSGIDPQLIDSIFAKKPIFLVEGIMVVPDAEAGYSLLDVYNAIGNVRSLKGRLYDSYTRDKKVPLFEEVTRIESPRRNTPVADPPPASRIPASETIFMRFKDVNFGNTFYRGDIVPFQRGLRYNLTNNKNITYFLVTVMGEEKFNMQLYLEVISEGVLIYSLASAVVSDFVSSKIRMGSAISRRLDVIIAWASEEIAKKGGAFKEAAPPREVMLP